MVIRDAAGQIVPFGKVHKQLVADFLYGMLPDWVEVVGTPTFEPLPDRGTITVTTPTTAGATAELKMKHLIDSSKVTANCNHFGSATIKREHWNLSSGWH
ncbi:hypothetical protein Q0F98_03895 [Paenibacillus amylolyticus]|nr:hypothetical protein Q0F98_03895 [Paenibacillus amylolyticus]